MEYRIHPIHGLFHPLAQAVVNVFAQGRAVFLHPDQAIIIIVDQGAVVDAGDLAGAVVGVI